MKLKEFDLWAFLLALPESRKFTLFNRIVCAHFERHFDPIETNNIYRIIIKLSEDKSRTNNIEESSSVLKYYKWFDFKYFDTLNEASKKKSLLDTLYNALQELCHIFKWPVKPFSEAYNAVIHENFINHYTFKKKNSRNRKHIAELECHHNSTEFNCFLNIKNKQGTKVFSKLVFTQEPDEFLFNYQLGDIKWIDNDTLALLKKDRTEIERISIKIQ